MKTLSEAPIKQGTKVFVRCDIDVPIERGVIQEKFRLDSSLNTLKYIIDKGGMPLIAGHMGKPKGQVNENLSTKYLLPYFDEKLGEGKFELLENLRFDSREETNDEKFSEELASKAELFVNESFATSHRQHASIVGITRFLPSYAGMTLEKEIESLSRVMNNPEKPLAVLIGGVKLESKLPIIERFQPIADFIMLSSLLSANWSKEITHNMLLADNRDLDSKDINDNTRQKFIWALEKSKTILWAGPLGMYEEEEFMAGTREIAQKISELTQNKGVYSVVGGGDTVAAINKLELLDKFSFVSTGGGAMLQFLAEGTLLGIEALNTCPKL
ncbi:phosphoglycerate kinase [Patescibacteria group bacterium]|nr:phosphoglycerate kinase [Patescibacteria group bacterium]